ncbi:histidine kinase dimerization/phosphoacceptor domain -containing protein [Erythrobacter sp. SD-21]|uniref:histidine kinase dimerization/phosphoacceptor domain -containing protein n=1 Tax=Erythrobacter sp. SD-21 TaxID=161528 RepID=UPI000153F4AD|nr:histidine kinase dimerization/phosphoacceptor domain -containing protein [Erythrobacter sp. SD-21]EDL49347.1 putative signal transduction histidine kinase with GAF domain [Erythrobacter sp. SD-21]
MKPRLHPEEEERLRELRRYSILDTERERDFDELVEIASDICEVPVSVVNFVDSGRQWFKAEVGLGVRSTPIETSLCGHVILQGDFVEIPDTLQDERMADNPLCTSEPGFRFYAGAVLKGTNGLPLGTLCVLDHKPRTLTDRQRNILRVLSKHVMSELNLRLALQEERILRREVDHRVKNSLASIGALLSMKARKTSNEALRLELDDASTRIRSLSSLHAELHELEAGGRIDLKSLFERVQTDLRYLIPDAATLSIEVEAIEATPQLANALLLVVNEFVSNSVKHGLKGAKGAITVLIEGDAGSWSIVCRDNGTATEIDAERAMSKSGLGTRVIHSLANSLNANAQWTASGEGMELKIAPQYN